MQLWAAHIHLISAFPTIVVELAANDGLIGYFSIPFCVPSSILTFYTKKVMNWRAVEIALICSLYRKFNGHNGSPGRRNYTQ
jgi:hypothetical protein